MKKKPMVMVALDHAQLGLARVLHKSRHDIGFKLNLDYLLGVGINDAGTMFKCFDRPLFADVKMWNGRRTMAAILERLDKAGFDYANVHVLAADQIPERKVEQDGLKLLGVALLTHYDEIWGRDWMNFQDTRSAIVRMSNSVAPLPLDGIIARVDCLGLFPDTMIKVAPGIRPSWFVDGRHPRSFTPAEAVGQGADILVIGSPITKADDPVEALDRIFGEIE